MENNDESKCILLQLSKRVPTDGSSSRSRLMWNATVWKNREDDRVYDEESGTLRLADTALTIAHNGKCIKLADDEIHSLCSALVQLQSYLRPNN